jgi:hypothetical protein
VGGVGLEEMPERVVRGIQLGGVEWEIHLARCLVLRILEIKKVLPAIRRFDFISLLSTLGKLLAELRTSN